MSDIFKKNPVTLNEEQKKFILELKTKAEELLTLYHSDFLKGFSLSKAIERLEESVMWAVNSATFEIVPERERGNVCSCGHLHAHKHF